MGTPFFCCKNIFKRYNAGSNLKNMTKNMTTIVNK